MAVDFYAKAGDRAPAITSTLVDADGEPVDLTGASVVFVMRPLGEATLTVSAAGEIVAPATSGTVRYLWGAADLADAGTYLAEWEVTAGGRLQTYPPDRQMVVMVSPDVSDAAVISPEDLDWLRPWVGSSPGDDELAERLARMSRTQVALGILRVRRADLLADPISYTIRGDVTVNAGDNLRALNDAIGTLEAADAADPDSDGYAPLSGAQLERCDTWGRGWYRHRIPS